MSTNLKKRRKSTQQWSVNEKQRLDSSFRMSFAYLDTVNKKKKILNKEGKTIYIENIYAPFEKFIGTRDNEQSVKSHLSKPKHYNDLTDRFDSFVNKDKLSIIENPNKLKIDTFMKASNLKFEPTPQIGDSANKLGNSSESRIGSAGILSTGSEHPGFHYGQGRINSGYRDYLNNPESFERELGGQSAQKTNMELFSFQKQHPSGANFHVVKQESLDIKIEANDIDSDIFNPDIVESQLSILNLIDTPSN